MKDLNFKIEVLISELKKTQQENETLINTCLEMIENYQRKITMYQENIHNKELFVKSQISALLEMNADKMKETKTELNYKVPSAKLYFKKESNIMKLKPEYNLSEIPKRFVKTEHKINWAAFKQVLKIVNDEVVNTQTGEIVKSVDIEKKEESDLNIKLL